MSAVFVSVSGVAETRAALERFVNVNVPREMRKAVRAGAKIERDAIRTETNFAGHGHNPYRAPGGLVSTIVYRAKGPYGYMVGPQGRAAYYAKYVVEGHAIRHSRRGASAGRVPGNPFVARGDERARPAAVAAITEGFRVAIETAGTP